MAFSLYAKAWAAPSTSKPAEPLKKFQITGYWSQLWISLKVKFTKNESLINVGIFTNNLVRINWIERPNFHYWEIGNVEPPGGTWLRTLLTDRWRNKPSMRRESNSRSLEFFALEAQALPLCYNRCPADWSRTREKLQDLPSHCEHPWISPLTQRPQQIPGETSSIWNSMMFFKMAEPIFMNSRVEHSCIQNNQSKFPWQVL